MSGKHSKGKENRGQMLLVLLLVVSVIMGVVSIAMDKLPALKEKIVAAKEEDGSGFSDKPVLDEGNDPYEGKQEQVDVSASTAGQSAESSTNGEAAGGQTTGEAAGAGQSSQAGAASAESGTQAEATAKEPADSRVTTLRIRCAGDVMAHDSQLKAAKTSDGYSFDSWFEYVKPYLQDADVTLINMETTFPGSDYHGYPSFRTPDQLAETVASLGTDVAIYANNHMLDSGQSGFTRSVGLMRDLGMEVCGGYLEGEEKTWTIVETTDGVKLGVVAYCYENYEQNGRRCLNGCYIPTALEPTINSFRYYNDDDMAEIKATIDACRADGADIVMAFMHWGEEYFIDPMKSQKDLAQIVVDCGVDFVIGSHPHVPEGIVYLTNKEGKEVPVYYSLGNFVSNQRTETMGSTQNKVHTEEGLIANVELSYNHATGQVSFNDVSAIPCWVEKYTKSGSSSPNYWIIPLVEGYENNPELNASGHLSRAAQALANITEIVGEEHIWDGTDSRKE